MKTEVSVQLGAVANHLIEIEKGASNSLSKHTVDVKNISDDLMEVIQKLNDFYHFQIKQDTETKSHLKSLVAKIKKDVSY